MYPTTGARRVVVDGGLADVRRALRTAFSPAKKQAGAPHREPPNSRNADQEHSWPGQNGIRAACALREKCSSDQSIPSAEPDGYR